MGGAYTMVRFRNTVFFVSIMAWVIVGYGQGMAQPTVLNWYGPSGPLVAEVAQQIADEYSKTNTHVNVQVTGQSTETHPDVLITQIVGGLVPDLVFIEQSHLAWWAHQGLLEPLDDLARTAGIEADEFIPATWQALQYQGQQYALPLLIEPYGLIWSVQMLEEAGFSPDDAPDTWNELLQHVRKLVRTDGEVTTHWGAQFGMGGAIFTSSTALNLGAQLDLPTADDARTYFDDPRWQTVFQAIVDIEVAQGGPSAWESYEQQYLGQRFTAIQNGWAQGTMGYAHSGAWIVNQIHGMNPEASMGIGRLPVLDGGREIITAKGWAVAIPKNAPNPEEAIRFLRYLYAPEPMETWYRHQSSIPSHLESLQYLVIEVMQELNSPAERIAFAELAMNVNAVTPPISPISQSMMGALHRAIQRVRGYQENPAQVLTDLNTELKAILDGLNR